MVKKVLIIEDDFIIQIFLEKIISKLGHNVVGTADNSDLGIELADTHSPDIVFMDIGINGKKDGIETAKIIKSKYDIPIVFITGNSDASTIKRAKETDPTSILRKPINEDLLKDEFNSIIEELN